METNYLVFIVFNSVRFTVTVSYGLSVIYEHLMNNCQSVNTSNAIIIASTSSVDESINERINERINMQPDFQLQRDFLTDDEVRTCLSAKQGSVPMHLPIYNQPVTLICLLTGQEKRLDLLRVIINRLGNSLSEVSLNPSFCTKRALCTPEI